MSNGGTPKGGRESDRPANELGLPNGTPYSHLMPGDQAYHDDKRLIADLTALNGQISRYVLRHLDAEAKRALPTSADDERTLGVHLVQFGMAVLGRVERRQHPPPGNCSEVEINKQT